LEVAADGAAAPVAKGDDAAAWFAARSTNAQSSATWADVLRKPVDLADLIRKPARAAAMLAPVMDAMQVQARRDRYARWDQRLWQWMAVMVNPILWPKALSALWEGEPMWDYIEQRSEWFDVVEAQIEDASTQMVLGRAESNLTRKIDHEPTLREMLHSPHHHQDAASPSEASKCSALVLVGTHCRLAVRVYGKPDASLRPALQRLCEEADLLVSNQGLAPLARAQAIDRVLQRALIRTSPTSSPWTRNTARVFTSTCTIGILTLLVYQGTQEYRWEQVMRALNDEPGIQVVQEQLAWGRRELIGVRTPDSRNPLDVLEELGVNTRNLDLHFKILRGGLRPGVKLAKPESKPKPISAALPAKTEMPTTQELDQLQARIARARIEFATGTEALESKSADTIAAICTDVADLHSMAVRAGRQLHVALRVAHSSTNPRGALWQLRYTSVRNALINSGVASSIIDPVLVTSTDEASTDNRQPDALTLRLNLSAAPSP
jgi:hypothetical protein